ncbi:UvrD-helicase domain-containing protein [Nodularia sp. NIES-3585]|uniref:UvrD-helicase domain-containing protein n=1 Tax=Nodularia sp. NIES-3585 TaxID=1973477 RepID=UPI000B5C2301|nr:UvrD-helicase domain-containing protein [Nodularia sp. NIES-3585]GAX39031.1 putative helicase [Nodularia sp. NIES-3585]
MSLTPQQEAAAYANGSVAVIAGAGTGKTHMLAERYLYHLREHKLSPLEVVAVTFTEKAAAELRSRIRSSVYKQLPDCSDLLAELEAAQISTIHALAMRICREHPLVADVPPDFAVLDEVEGVLGSTQWFDEALDTLPGNLYEQVPFSLMSKALRALLKDPITAKEALEQGTERWQQLAQDLQQKALNELLEDLVWQEARDTLQAYQGKAGDRLEAEARQPAIAAIDAIESGENIKAALLVIDGLKINVGSKKNWVEGALEIVKKAIKQLRELVQNSLEAGLITLEIGAADEQLAAMLPALREAFGWVQEYLNQAKRRARLLDFADIEVHALLALEDEQVQNYYAQRWKAFLVDEFQDTNPIQSKILELLTQSTRLTIVGDAKQSIYGFRRADVEVFQTWRNRIRRTGDDGIRNYNGHEVTLNISFRTHQPLVQNINSIFAPILGTLHQNLEGNRTLPPNSHPPIQVYAVQAESGVNKPPCLRVEARHIADLLKDMLEQQTLVHDKKTGNLRPIAAGDIAILSRTWEPLENYGEALESLGIPTALAGGGNLLATREAKDAWALLQFLADPSDDLALVAVLRSPFFAVSDRLLFSYAQQQATIAAESKSQNALEKTRTKIDWWQKLKTTDIPEFSRPVQVLSQLLRDRNLEPPTRLLQLADHLTGYTAVITNLPGANRREADWRGFMELVRQLEHGSHDVFAIVRRLKQLADAEVEIPRLPLSTNDAVALMTIHAAKGLEWPVVVVPDLTRSRNNNSQTIYFDPVHGVALKQEDEQGEAQKPVLYFWLEYLRKQREESEALRVLYVALTRARDQLILTATEEKGGGLTKLQPGLEAAGITIQPIPFDPELAQPPILREPPLPPESDTWLINSVGSGLFELPVTALSDYAQCPRKFYHRFIQGHPGIGSGIGTARRLGTLVHLALERNIRDVEKLEGFDVVLGRDSVAEALELAKRFDEVENFAPFRQANTQWEQPVTLSIGRLTLNGIVDLLGSDWVLDFKTDQEMTPQHHRFQLWAYAQATGRTTAHIAYLRHDRLHTFNAEDLQITAQEAEILVQRILAGDYSAVPSPVNCSFCAYADICEARYQG